MENLRRKIAVIDFETEPFEKVDGKDHVPEAFACGFFDGETYSVIWHDDEKKVLKWAHEKVKKFDGIVYAHNGGKFDFIGYLFKVAGKTLHGESPDMRGSRIVRLKYGKGEIRDSYAILPAPLSSYDKGDIDYKLFRKGIRDKHREKILKYLRRDCVSLYGLVSAFISIHGQKPLTAAAASFAFLKAMGYDIDPLSAEQDTKFRGFYYGGHCEAYEQGIFRGRFYVPDMKSAYPWAMTKLHAFCNEFDFLVAPKTVIEQDFVCFEGHAKGCFPMRTKDGLDFPHISGKFYVTGWEYLRAKELGLCRGKVLYVERPKVCAEFGKFVYYWFDLKEAAEAKGDKAGRLIAKISVNAAYGKFAQRPDKYRDYLIVDWQAEIPCDEDDEPLYEEEYVDEENGFAVWSTESKKPPTYYNVATAGSITGCVRARLIGEEMMYCDTDSKICRHKPKLGKGLGAWNLEVEGDLLYIAGKKLYALRLLKKYCAGKKDAKAKGYWWDEKEKRAWKIASKGARLTPNDMKDLCEGKIVLWENPAPSFSLKSKTHFVKRRIKMKPKGK